MAKTIKIDPISRIEGHLAIRVEIEANRVSKAFSSGEMFRGFETILAGRHPLDAQQITQRICGVCPIGHGMASILAQDAAYGITPPDNGRLLRNLILGANYIQSHITHFYLLSALDFVDLKAVAQYQGNDPQLLDIKRWIQSQVTSKANFPGAPFLPRYEGKYLGSSELNILAIKHYLEALEMRALAHKMAAIFCGKIPHAATLVPGGVTEKVTALNIAAYKSMLQRLQEFINSAYLPDVIGVAGAFPEYFDMGKGCGNYLVYGVFPESADGSKKLFPAGVATSGKLTALEVDKITEDVMYSLYSSPSGLRPDEGQTNPSPRKNGAYSWLKAPRYKQTVMEVGPLARLMIIYLQGDRPPVNKMIDDLLQQFNRKPGDLNSVLGRHAARAIECKIVADSCAAWLEQLLPDKPAFLDFAIPARAKGVGLTEAARGALGHWLEISDHKISRYQCIVPTTWNCSPRDDKGNPGAIEQALVGTPIADDANPLEAARVVRSFDPCIACAVH